ncbi:MAG: RHS repeat-associated core domain-containing protein [Pseudomonadota bacterium]
MTCYTQSVSEITKRLWLGLSMITLFVMMTIGASANDVITRTSSFTYHPVTGLLETETVEPGDSQFELVTTHGYDDYGNSTSVTTAHGASVVASRQITSRTSSVTFGTKGQFPTSVTNALGHTESSIYDAKFGVATSTTGPNGLTTSSTYDELGRPSRETRADGTYTDYAYEYCSGVVSGPNFDIYSGTCPTHATYVVTAIPKDDQNQPNGPFVRTFNDSHGREVASETQGFDGALIRVKTEYNNLGQTARESLPYYVNQGLNSDAWTDYTLDDLGRVIRVELPDGSEATTSYDALTTTVTNDLGQTTTTVKNVRGEIVSVTDNLGSTTTYTYDAFGNTTSITDSEGNVSTTSYDKTGNKLSTNDPDMGVWTYSYNVLGELVSQTDAKSQTVTMTYDLLGRPTQRVEADGTSSWTYDVGFKAKGKLSSTSRGTHSQSFTYDNRGRPSTLSQTLDGATESFTATYDNSSRLKTVTYPSGFVAEYLYNAYGYEHQLKEQGGATLWTADVIDAQQRITQETAGNGVVTNRAFDALKGTIDTIQAGVGGTNSVANMAFTFDDIGNLRERQDLTQSVTEKFDYDGLNRLTCYYIGAQACGQGSNSKTVTYDATGNILSKSDIGTYTYGTLNNNSHGPGQSRPHALAQTVGAVNATYTYDANGNMLSGADRTITWSSFNKVTQIVDASGTTTKTLSFVYGADRQRVKMTSSAGDTFYHSAFGVMAEQVVNGLGKVKWTNYLYAGGQMVGVHTDDDTLTTREITKSWFVADHLGSISVITDETGTVVERLAYDAWGKRRNADGTDDTGGTLTSDTTPRGFTGHEMLDDTDLVNMNGRIYDPSIGRFLSADIYIQDPMLSQSLNRYAYVWNNPLSYTDPSGHFVAELWAAVKVVAQIYSIFSSVKAIIENPKFFALQIFFRATLPFGDFVADGLAAAITVGLDGGDVGDMFTAAAITAANTKISQALDNYVGEYNPDRAVDALVANAIVGGATAELGGGKFAHGAASRGFQYAVGRPEFTGWYGKDGYLIDGDGKVEDANAALAENPSEIYLNGMRGNPNRAANRVGDYGGLGYFNPTNGVGADLWESVQQIFFPQRDGHARALANYTNMISQDVDLTVNAVSQGGLTAINAAGFFNARPNINYRFYGSAGNYFRSENLVGRSNSTITLWNTPYGDAANLYTEYFNPFKWASGVGDIINGGAVHRDNYPRP